ncbi:MAG: radical SAM protein [Bacteroidales bacterium]
MQKHYNIPIFLPELACHNKCVFCNQQNISNTHNIPDISDAQNIIDKHISTIPKSASIQIAFFGGNFTGLPLEQQRAFLTLAQSYIQKGAVEGIRISTRPDYISEHILHMLKSYGVQDIELGAQSYDNDVLAASQRGHTAEQIKMAAKQITAHKFKLGLQMMIGLPGDTYEKSMNTARQIIACKAHTTRIYPCLVIAHTALAHMYKNGTYTPLDIATATKWLADIYSLFTEHSINILRIGLHPSKDFESPDILLAGPYHPSIKQLAITHMWKKRFMHKLPHQHGKLHIYVSPGDIPYAIGYKSSNKLWLQQTYGWVSIQSDSKLQKNEFTYCYH